MFGNVANDRAPIAGKALAVRDMTRIRQHYSVLELSRHATRRDLFTSANDPYRTFQGWTLKGRAGRGKQDLSPLTGGWSTPMIVPAVETIEEAIDSLKDQTPWVIADEIKEFNSLGGARMSAVRAQAAAYGVPALGRQDMLVGYLLGIETARVLIAGMPAAVEAGVKF